MALEHEQRGGGRACGRVGRGLIVGGIDLTQGISGADPCADVEGN